MTASASMFSMALSIIPCFCRYFRRCAGRTSFRWPEYHGSSQAFGRRQLCDGGWPEGPVTPARDLKAGLAWADAVSVNVPRTDRPVIGAEELAALKPVAILVNTA